MYLVGTFKRFYHNRVSNHDPLKDVRVAKEVTHDDFLRSALHDNYQIINLETEEYYNPKQATWIKLNK